MKERLLNIVSLISVLLVLQACEKLDSPKVELSQKAIAVSGTTDNSGVLGKTNADSPIAIDNFSVFAYYTGTNDISTVSLPEANWLKDELIFWDGGKFDYVNTAYWPADPTTKLSFFAYSPTQSSSDNVSISSPDINSQGLPKIDYNLVADNHTEDLLVSDPLLNLNSDNGNVVFTLGHALSKLNFKVATNLVDRVKLYSVGIENLPLSASYDYSDVTAPIWDNHNNYGNLINEDVNNLGELILTTSLQTIDPEFFVIPQTFDDPLTTPRITFQLELDWVDNGDGTITPGLYYTTSFSPIGAWLKGNVYTYNVTINAGDIKVDVDVADWITLDVDHEISDVDLGQLYVNLSTRDLDLSVGNAIYYETNFTGLRIADEAIYKTGTDIGNTFTLSDFYAVTVETDNINFVDNVKGNKPPNAESFTCYLECLDAKFDIVQKIAINVTP